MAGLEGVSEEIETLEQKVLRLELENAELKTLVRTDVLTGLPNRMATEEALNHELALVRRGLGQAVILFIDVDDFKGVNDGYGHAQGDNVLKAMAEMLRTLGRQSDVFGRYAGDEFVGILPIESDVTVEVMQKALAKFNDGARKINRTGAVGSFEPQTLSIGGVIVDSTLDVPWEQVRDAADANLAISKRQGKDQLTLSNLREAALVAPAPQLAEFST